VTLYTQLLHNLIMRLLRNIVALLLTIGAASLQPYCIQLQHQPLIKTLTPNETYRLDLTKYFKGMNLHYSLSEELP